MTPILATWRYDPLLIGLLLAVAALYLRGWRRLRAARPERRSPFPALSFLGGLALLWVAIGSPLDGYADLWLRAHMLQHLLLMSAVPPLLWLGAPYRPLLVGLPAGLRRELVGPLLGWPTVRRLGAALVHPAAAAGLLAVVTWTWHVPALYELALRSPLWHDVEHALFLGAALLLWFAVVQPPPATGRLRGAAILALVATVLQTSALAALLVFSDRVLYPSYARGPQVGSLSPLEDQAAAGALLWLFDSVITVAGAMLATVAWLGPTLVRPGPASPSGAPRAGRRRSVPFDLLRAPVVGALLLPRRTRVALRSAMLALAVLIVWDGFQGPSAAYANAAGVLPWTHWRGLAVLSLLVAGNFFCMACPFLLPRDLGRKLLGGGGRWPRALRSKWLAVGLVVAWLWTYEVLAPWDAPTFTAWIVVGYFVAAFAIDGWFRGASFCKYVCPIGQMHFVQSLVSPLEVKARDPSVCAGCRTQDCLRGRGAQRGCELGLFLPTKSGSLDCTFCLDCADACPHANVGILVVAPGSTLLDDRPRSSLGRIGERFDLAALALVFVFGAFASAAVMTAPAAGFLRSTAGRLGMTFELSTSAALLASVVLLPLATVGGASWLGARLDGAVSAAWTFRRLALALVPLGATMAAGHLLVHLVAGWAGILPVLVRLAGERGWTQAGPDWSLAHAVPAGAWLRSAELLLLDAGLLLTLYLGWRIAAGSGARRPALLWLPWGLVAIGLWAFGAWLTFQPMEMRGTMVMP